MKKTLLVTLIVLLSLGVLAAAGFTGYHFGYARGTMATQGRADTVFGHYDRFFGPNDMPGYGFQRGNRDPHHGGMGPGGFSRFDRGRGFDFHSPIFFLFRIAVLGLVIWLVYRLFKGNGWQLTFARMPVQTPPAGSVDSTVENKSDQG